MQAADVKKAVVLGHSMGCQVALETAVQAPEKVAGMVLMQGSAGKVLDTFFDSPNSVVIHRWLERGVDLFGHRLQGLTRRLLALPVAWTFTSKLGLVDPYYTKREDFVPYLDHMGKLDPRLFLHMVSKAHEHNLYPVLDEIHQPALVVAAEKDTFTPMWLSKRMVREMPNARLLVLAEATHAAIIEQPHTINASVRGFLRDLAWV
jgi:pimeloyl-ACP methyl ester carboxylesterase